MNENKDHKEIFAVVSDIIRSVTGNSGLTIKPEYTADDIKNWDSLRHVMIINEIENRYAIHFDLMEMLDITSVDDLCHAVSKKQSKA
ncbi:MAG: acyl carrier protein [Bacteroidales bacterium]|nr:acyl carrier protein [Bacteroidales bacterium]MBN2764111.1 acyl carrier protein [Bacteroidales bacterium]